MNLYIIIIAAVLMLVSVFLFRAFISWGTRWGATAAECAAAMTGDAYLQGGPPARVTMTRAISLAPPPDAVWPWLAQMGRGAGWYSYDFLDNGNKASALHLVSWIPAPQLGDASAIGYLRHLEPGRELVWWVGGEHFLGSKARMVVDILVTPQDRGSRLVIRMSGDAGGPLARLAVGVFQVMDSIMARRQLLGIKERVEKYQVRTGDPENPENGRPDQYQYYETIYASGQSVGVPGREKGALWRQMALEDQVLVEKKE
jgi:hypothetical protein